mmetsp:Transcript_52841/g.169212  ORF Transcript_52841/g.169212 Transcript_52841/m.169212 type:complete len:302 (-) Transcript_52841:299-1204(-)
MSARNLSGRSASAARTEPSRTRARMQPPQAPLVAKGSSAAVSQKSSGSPPAVWAGSPATHQPAASRPSAPSRKCRKAPAAPPTRLNMGRPACEPQRTKSAAAPSGPWISRATRGREGGLTAAARPSILGTTCAHASSSSRAPSTSPQATTPLALHCRSSESEANLSVSRSSLALSSIFPWLRASHAASEVPLPLRLPPLRCTSSCPSSRFLLRPLCADSLASLVSACLARFARDRFSRSCALRSFLALRAFFPFCFSCLRSAVPALVLASRCFLRLSSLLRSFRAFFFSFFLRFHSSRSVS